LDGGYSRRRRPSRVDDDEEDADASVGKDGDNDDMVIVNGPLLLLLRMVAWKRAAVLLRSTDSTGRLQEKEGAYYLFRRSSERLSFDNDDDYDSGPRPPPVGEMALLPGKHR
jgi:hypothetical protein